MGQDGIPMSISVLFAVIIAAAVLGSTFIIGLVLMAMLTG
jgi:hypothetical protein